MRVTLQEDLDSINANLLEEGQLVLRALRGSLNALGEADAELADEVDDVETRAQASRLHQLQDHVRVADDRRESVFGQ